MPATLSCVRFEGAEMPRVYYSGNHIKPWEAVLLVDTIDYLVSHFVQPAVDAFPRLRSVVCAATRVPLTVQVAPRDLHLTPCRASNGGGYAAPWATGRGSDNGSDDASGSEGGDGGSSGGGGRGWRVAVEDGADAIGGASGAGGRTQGEGAIRAGDGLLVKEVTVTFTRV
ncbi:hypothetical protein FOA52_010247 [Chlamydomonas sp. UWO 241]|nr:hypothetical protein FOA52_010247 [Chlamydomonas sp. UWO 241]